MHSLGRIFSLSFALILFAGSVGAKETIVFVRHGEKPEKPSSSLGQLDCKGLNRALKLPSMIKGMFGKPAAIFAPNPADQKVDEDGLYDYVRPLATIEPTAIAFGMPVNAHIGTTNVEALAATLEEPAYHDAFVLVAWEHKMIMDIARQLLNDNGGNPDAVPKWKGSDFDSIYVVTIDWSGPKAAFEQKSEGLDGQPDACPQ
jgi:hypothetical protein